MAATMLAYRMLNWQQPPQIVDVEVPTPGPGEVLVAVAGNGLCHSDLAMMQMPAAAGAWVGWNMPFTLGHEIAGHVAALGPSVRGSGVSIGIGEAVALISPASCGTCSFCVRGQDSACPLGLAGRGYGRDGGLAPFVVADAARSLVPIGSLDPLAAAPMTDAGATSYHAVRRALPHVLPGSTAVVLGAGGLGAFAIQLLRVLSPATVVAVDANSARLEVALSLGAHHAISGVDADTVERVRSLSHGAGATVVLDFVGIDSTIEAGLAMVRAYGAYGLIGAAGGTLAKPWYGGLPKDADVFTFQGSCISDARDVIALAQRGLIRSDVDLFPFEAVDEAYDALHHGRLRGRAVVTPPKG